MFLPLRRGSAGRRKRPGIRVGLTQKCSRGDSSISHNIIQRRKDAPKTIDNHLGLNYPDEPDKLGGGSQNRIRRKDTGMSNGSPTPCDTAHSGLPFAVSALHLIRF